jgi:hypothetical protein
LSLVFEIKQVSTHSKRDGKRTLKSKDGLSAELEKATVAALEQIKMRQYRTRAPLHTTKIHEYGLEFAGKFCLVAVCTLEHHDGKSDWQEKKNQSAVVPELLHVEEDDKEDSDGMDVDDEM